MKSYYDNAYRSSSLHRRHKKRRRTRKAKMLFLLLGLLCVVIAVAFTGAGLLVKSPAARIRWLWGGGAYLGVGLVLLLFRAAMGLMEGPDAGRKGQARAEPGDDALGGERAANGPTTD